MINKCGIMWKKMVSDSHISMCGNVEVRDQVWVAIYNGLRGTILADPFILSRMIRRIYETKNG